MRATGVWRAVAVAVAVALAAEVAFIVVTLLTKPPRGPASSSYATGHRGARGFAGLVERGGHEVHRRRVPLDVERPDTTDTVVILDAARPDRRELVAIEAFVRAGGRLVVASKPEDDEWLEALVGGLRRGDNALLGCERLASVPETAGVASLESSGKPGWRDTGIAVPVLGCNGNALVAVAAVGGGRVVLVSDSAVFQNYLLAARDNAAFAVNAVGGVRRDVIFLEHVHGFRAPSGLAALPSRWLLAAATALLAAVLAVLARRRIVATRVTAPQADHPRSVHAAAVAERLSTADARDAAGVVRAAARRAVAAAVGLPADAASSDLEAAAISRGLADPDDIRRAIGAGPDDEAATVAAGRVLAACTRRSPIA